MENWHPLECLTKPHTFLSTPWRRLHATFFLWFAVTESLLSPSHRSGHTTPWWHLLAIGEWHTLWSQRGPHWKLFSLHLYPTLGTVYCHYHEVLGNCWTQATSFSFCSRPVNYVLGLLHSTMSFSETGAVFPTHWRSSWFAQRTPGTDQRWHK